MDWIGAVEKVGLAATLLIAVLWCIWRFAFYFTEQIIVPVKDAHIAYLRDTCDMARTQKDEVAKIRSTQDIMHGKVDTISERVGDIHDLLRDKK